MLRWIGEGEAANILLEAIETVCEKGIVTRDLGGTATTVQVTEAVCAEIGKALGVKPNKA